MYKIKVEKLFDDVVLPSYAHEGDAGLDLRAYHIVKTISPYREVCKDDVPLLKDGFGLEPGYIVMIGTGIKCEFPENVGGFLHMRSGISANNGIMLLNGVGLIDSIYRGEICIPVMNMLDVPYIVERGERIAQLVGFKQIKFDVEETDSINESVRGENGFGSSGKK